jgi:hypothetical protein
MRPWLLALAACSHKAAEPLVLAPVAPAALCVTKGELTGNTVDAPTFRAVSRESTGDAASLAFTTHGETSTTRELASGQLRRQLGLKLRAADGCNLVYVMWRLDPKPMLEVSVKSNPGKHDSKECGANGYIKVKPTRSVRDLRAGEPHELRAEIAGDELTASIDGTVVWHGELPDEARALTGPAGIRSDNLAFEIRSFAAPKAASVAPCADKASD